MAQVALFHSVLGVRPGIHEAATRLRAAGHDVLVVDQSRDACSTTMPRRAPTPSPSATPS